MGILIGFLLVTSYVGLVYSLYMRFYRIDKVSEFRLRLVDRTSEASIYLIYDTDAIKNGTYDGQMLWNIYRSLPSYDKMVNQFWKKPESFIPEQYKDFYLCFLSA